MYHYNPTCVYQKSNQEYYDTTKLQKTWPKAIDLGGTHRISPSSLGLCTIHPHGKSWVVSTHSGILGWAYTTVARYHGSRT